MGEGTRAAVGENTHFLECLNRRSTDGESKEPYLNNSGGEGPDYHTSTRRVVLQRGKEPQHSQWKKKWQNSKSRQNASSSKTTTKDEEKRREEHRERSSRWGRGAVKAKRSFERKAGLRGKQHHLLFAGGGEEGRQEYPVPNPACAANAGDPVGGGELLQRPLLD